MPFISGGGLQTTTGFTLRQVTTITASQTYNVPTNVTALYVEALGAGGQGGGTAATGAGQCATAGGGGGGGYSAAWLTGLGASFVVTIGAGGSNVAAGNSTGQAGGDTSFGVAVVAKGGAGGAGSPVIGSIGFGGLGGSGGQASAATGDVKLDGGAGLTGFVLSVTSYIEGTGGWAPLGAAGPFAALNSSTGTGRTGAQFGGGGGGAVAGASQGAQQGGPGVAGLVRVWEFRKG